MRQTLQSAALALLKRIHAPLGVVNILPIEDAGGARLVVWVDSVYFGKVGDIPSLYEGYPVTVQVKPRISASM